MPLTPKTRAWLQLLRVPNLFTVPGDPLAGFLLAGGTAWASAGVAAAVSLLLYAAGLVHNDLCDRNVDAVERPSRPLPSGRISVRAAWVATIVLLGGGLALACAVGGTMPIVAGATALAVLCYNAFAKRIRILGPINMGLCRGLSVLVGASAAGPDGLKSLPAVFAAVLIAAYIAAVTAIAAGETTGKPVGMRRNLPTALLAFTMVLAFPAGTSWPLPVAASWVVWVPVALLALATIWSARCAVAIARDPSPPTVGKTIGRLIRCLVVLQAALAAMAGLPGLIISAALALVLLPASAALGRRFYAS